MRVLITNSPAYIQDMYRHFTYGSRFGCSDPIPYGSNIKEHYSAYPWSLGYASSLLKYKTDFKVKGLDAQARDYNEVDFVKYIRRYKPDLIVADLPTISFPLMMELLKNIKDEIDCKIILSGLHVSGLPIQTMEENPFIDYVLTREYELALPKFIKIVEEEKKDFTEIPNLYFWKGNEIKKTKADTFYVDFDLLPYPDREDLPVEMYHDFEVAGKPTIQMLTSRGCPCQCTFCCTTVYWPNGAYWQRSASNVVDEMEYAKDKYGAKQIYFDDDVVSIKMLNELSKEILDRKLDLPWTFMGNINIPEDTLKLISRAGAIGVKFGVESINTRVLANINKRWVNKEKVERFVELCRRYDLWRHGTFIIGLPQDNRESILKMLQFAIDLDLDTAQFYIATPIPRTKFFELAKKSGWLVGENWLYFDGNNYSNLDYPWLSKEEIEELTKICKREWELSAFKKYIKHPKRIWRYLQGRGLHYTLQKVQTLLTNKGHILTAGL